MIQNSSNRENAAGTTSDFLGILRSEIESNLFDNVIALLAPKIEEMMLRNIFTFKEALAYLKLSESTLRRMVKDEQIPHYRLRGAVYFRQWELNEFIEKRMIGKAKNKSRLA